MLLYTSMNSKQNNNYKMNQSAHTLKKYIKKHTTQHNQKKKIFFLQKRDKKISNKNTNHNKNKKNKRKNNKQKKICFD